MKKSELLEILPIFLFIILAILNLADSYLLIPKYSLIIDDLKLNTLFGGFAETAIGLVTTITTVVSGVSMIFWGYYADRIERKKALFLSSLVWSIFSFLTFFSMNYVYLFIVRALTGIGLGCVLPIGFSILSDYVSPERRGFAFAWWGAAIGAGTAVGYAITILVADWKTPFLIVSILGLGFTFLFLFIKEPKKAKKEKEFEELIADGHVYDYKIKLDDLKLAWTQNTNRWVILQGVFGCIPWGIFSAWLPFYFSQKFFLHGGISIQVAATIGALLGGIFVAGAAIGNFIFGWLGDKWKHPRGRLILCVISVFGGIPLILIAVLIPFNIVTVIPDNSDFLSIASALINEIWVNNPTLNGIFIMSIIGSTIAGGCGPNWYAVTADINLPEHRGSIMSISTMVDTIGRGLGPFLGGLIINVLALSFGLIFPITLNLTLMIAALFWIPCGAFFCLALPTYLDDKGQVNITLKERAKEVKSKPKNQANDLNKSTENS